ncbi:MAG: C1 family peptidase [Planctomycetes bacterium]|nr:C1 family peptidase [Planctomycetota bacterium]
MSVFISHGVDVRRLSIRPDDTDARDFVFTPTLAPLPARSAPARARILDQAGEDSCVGFALAAVINAGLSRRRDRRTRLTDRDLPSERMLYEMARRYDEWAGEHYQGTSLRGAMKGWSRHGVASRAAWPYQSGKPGHLSPERAADAMRRPLGAYYRVVDHDVSQVQAAIIEGDAVLASLWLHDGWKEGGLRRPRASVRSRAGNLARILPSPGRVGLHAVALVGYNEDGFIVQNSWGPRWGTKGLAVLAYEDWVENRQDAWVGRIGPETRDASGHPRIFTGGFLGTPATPRVGTAGTEGLGVSPESLPYLISTGDRGRLSSDGRLSTPAADLPAMAAKILEYPAIDGVRHILLYAHGGLVSETEGAQHADRLSRLCRSRRLPAFFFVWETGFSESLWGRTVSRDDDQGPRAGSAWSDAWNWVSDQARKRLIAAQRATGAALAPLGRVFWNEMNGRAQGAASAAGGAARFARELMRVITQADTREPFRIHLAAHSAGSIYLAHLYRSSLARAIARSRGRATLGSIRFLAPAVSVDRAAGAFLTEGRAPVAKRDFTIHTLSDAAEETDSIRVYPSSLLTYVADHLESDRARVPVLGIRRDADGSAFGRAATIIPTACAHHGDLDNLARESGETPGVFDEIVNGILGKD